MPSRLRFELGEYRRNRKTTTTIACLFGSVTLRRWIYQSVEAGEAALFPLQIALGITAGVATPALADIVGRLMAELPQQQTLAVLRERYGVFWSVGTLRKVTADLAAILAPLRHESQVAYLVELLRQARESAGEHAISLVVGRDGIMIPMRSQWEEAATATVSVYDRSGDRLGTVYLARMPESGQGTISSQLTKLIDGVLNAWDGRLPRLHYVTDAGHHPQDYFRGILTPMKHPRTRERLKWTWSVDFYHAAERITTLAEALFGVGPAANAWAEKQRKILKSKTNGPRRVIQAARALRRSRGLKCLRRQFNEAINYLHKYRAHMQYAIHRRRGLPIGSGVTEAACKTIFTQRMKQSGMRWKSDTGQHILDLRVILRSNIWNRLRQRWLRITPRCKTCKIQDSIDLPLQIA